MDTERRVPIAHPVLFSQPALLEPFPWSEQWTLVSSDHVLSAHWQTSELFSSKLLDQANDIWLCSECPCKFFFSSLFPLFKKILTQPVVLWNSYLLGLIIPFCIKLFLYPLINWKLYVKAGGIQIEHSGWGCSIGDPVPSCCTTSEDIRSGQPPVADRNGRGAGRWQPRASAVTVKWSVWC